MTPDQLHQRRPSVSQRIRRSAFLLIGLIGVLAATYAFWTPGANVRDGRHDRGRNGLWLAHGWLGADEWFERHRKQSQIDTYRSAAALHDLAESCVHHGIVDLFPHLCPCDVKGELPPVDDLQTERFLDGLTPACRVIPWIGGPSPDPANYHDAPWRATFCGSVGRLLAKHPRLAGIQLNIEPLPSGDADFLRLLEELRTALPAGKILSVAAYPPPTRWQPNAEIHWDQPFFRAVAKRADQLVVMMYDTALSHPKLYQKLMSDWTVEVLAWAEGKSVLLGLAAYEDSGVGYHHAATENLPNGLLGIHAGLQRAHQPTHYQGAAIYCHWEMNDTKWAIWQERFQRKPSKR